MVFLIVMYYIWRLLFSRSYCRPCRVINWAQPILVTNKNKRTFQLNSVCIIHMRLGIWWLKRIENLLSLQLEPPTFFLPSYFFPERRRKKLNAPLFYVASGAKGCQPSFFLLLEQKKVYDGGGRETSLFFYLFLYFSLEWRYNIWFYCTWRKQKRNEFF